jgi:peptidoglycan hydrolase FlgJ
MTPINAISSSISSGELQAPDSSAKLEALGSTKDPEKTAEVSRQFEAILLRQFLGESMKPLLEDGPSGQVYGYLLTDSLANTITKAGGLGIANILQAQLTQ